MLAPMPDGWQPEPWMQSAASKRLLDASRAALAQAGFAGDECLTAICASAAECWGGHLHRPRDEVLPRLPWIGPEYRVDGVVVVGMNAQSHAGLMDEAYVVAETCRQLSAGRQRFFGVSDARPSWFHYRAAAVAGLLIDARAGRALTIRRPAASVAALLGSARVQAVQCSPAASSRRTPSASMLRLCPPRAAWPVLEVLRPAHIAVLGTEARSAFERRYAVTWTVNEPLLRVGLTMIAGNQAQVFGLRHPSSGFGMRSIRRLAELLDDDRGFLLS
jgi:hypothetical protein